jgi:hypothetical protein
LIVLFVAEDRDLLHGPAPPQARELYANYFSTARLRDMAAAGRVGGWHTDL